jgi:hypothetical protein
MFINFGNTFNCIPTDKLPGELSHISHLPSETYIKLELLQEQIT